MTAEEQAKISALRRTEIFGGLADEALRGLASEAVFRLFKSGTVLFHEGDPADYLFIVKSGYAKNFKTARSGKTVTFALSASGDAVNGLAIASATHYLTAQAITDLVTLRVPRPIFLTFLHENPAVATQLLAVVAGSMDREHERLLELFSEDAEYRLVHTLRLLVKRFGTRILLSREDLAEVTCMTAETTIRLLGRLKHQGVVAANAERGVLVISDPAKLESYKVL